MFYITQYVYINRTLELSFQLNKNLLLCSLLKKKMIMEEGRENR